MFFLNAARTSRCVDVQPSVDVPARCPGSRSWLAAFATPGAKLGLPAGIGGVFSATRLELRQDSELVLPKSPRCGSATCEVGELSARTWR